MLRPLLYTSRVNDDPICKQATDSHEEIQKAVQRTAVLVGDSGGPIHTVSELLFGRPMIDRPLESTVTLPKAM